MSSTDPAIAHNQTLSQVAEKYANVPVGPPIPQQAAAPVAPPEPEAPKAEATPTPETPAPGVGASGTQPAAPAAPAKPDRLQRSLEIQRRAEAAARRARTEASKLKQPAPAPKEEPKPAPQANPQVESEVAQLKAQLEAEIRLVKTDPTTFMRKAGMTAPQIAEFMRQGNDPTARAVELLRAETAREIARVRAETKAEYDSKFEALAGQIVQDQEVRAQTNFFTFVEEAKEQNPDAFKAIGSGLLYSEAELWNRANEILANRPDLQKDFDEDKLLEAVETEARKDPRWSKLEPLLQSKQQNKPNVVTTEKPNASAQVEPPEVKEPPVQRQSQPRERDPQSGQFVQQRKSPLEDHTRHVDTVVNRVLGRPFGR